MTTAVTDFTQYDRMRLDADAKDPAILREVAGQFEALFLEILLKNMRASSLGDPIFGQSSQHDMYQEMLDKQFAVEMSKDRGIGMADMLVAQLGGNSSEETVAPMRTEISPVSKNKGSWSKPVDFAKDVWPHAERAGKKLGIAPESLLAQAALETGWGSRVMDRADGGSSFNLFGIKVGRSWSGDDVARSTLEYRDGVAHREVAKFRAYTDISASFDDYVSFINDRPRYAAVLGSGADSARFGDALRASGYATDPDYAQKIERIVGGKTMQAVLRDLKNDGHLPTNQLMSLASAADTGAD